MQAAPDALLHIENLTRVFSSRSGLSSRKVLAVDRANLRLPAAQHEILTIAGESGSGKTTLARMILGLVEPSEGRLLFKGQDVGHLRGRTQRMWFRRQVQPVFQDPFATFNPLRRIESYLYETVGNYAVAPRRTADQPIDRALGAVGLSFREVKGRYPSELSGGQLQRISIARALITDPSLLIADEPVSMLDASLRMSIVNLFRDLKARQSVVYITHDLATAYYASDRVAIMLRGWIVELGPVQKVLGEPLHPYTQLLKTSVLEPDPRQKSSQRVSLSASEDSTFLRVGCRFADRCPRVMDICRGVEPANIDVDGRTVKCHLYADGSSVQDLHAPALVSIQA
ncbi:MAG: ABC transporter ATP-binding protein [Chloroflexota bacterium]|nr:ABC transporter ATP-binding protein [Chloroflexota bacterium]